MGDQSGITGVFSTLSLDLTFFVSIVYLLFIFLVVAVVAVQDLLISCLLLIGAFLLVGLLFIIYSFFFIGLVFLIVYVGAIAVLFLFVILMLNATPTTFRALEDNSLYGLIFFTFSLFCLALLVLRWYTLTFFAPLWLPAAEIGALTEFSFSVETFLFAANSNNTHSYGQLVDSAFTLPFGESGGNEIFMLGYFLYELCWLQLVLVGLCLLVGIFGVIEAADFQLPLAVSSANVHSSSLAAAVRSSDFYLTSGKLYTASANVAA